VIHLKKLPVSLDSVSVPQIQPYANLFSIFTTRRPCLGGFLGESVAVVLRGVVNCLPHGHDAEGVDGRMAPIVVVLDMVHVDSAADAGVLKQVFRVVEQIGILTDEPLVGLEVDKIDLMKRISVMNKRMSASVSSSPAM